VAVKVIRPELAADRDFRSRFAREVSAARRVSGMFTAPVVAADPDGHPPWLATAYVPGPSLAGAVAQRGPLPPDVVLTLTAGLAEALLAIHAADRVLRHAETPQSRHLGLRLARFAALTLTPSHAISRQ
jgi:serine/threonine protein kinase